MNFPIRPNFETLYSNLAILFYMTIAVFTQNRLLVGQITSCENLSDKILDEQVV